MAFNIEITERERASNVAFQIKQLLIQLQTNIKPQLVNAATLIENGADGLSKEALVQALGGDEDTKEYLGKIKGIKDIIP